MGTGTTRAPSSVAIFWGPPGLPLSARTTSPSMLLSRRAATAWRTQEAGVEIADEYLGAFAASYVVSLFAVGNGGEVGVEWRVGQVDLGEDTDTGETCPVDVVHAGDCAYAGDGVTGAYAEIVEGVGGGEDVMVVPSCRLQGKDEIATEL